MGANSSTWASEPEHPDDAVRERTGHGWAEWVELIDAGPGRNAGHPAIARWVHEQGVDAWWAQAVTVGFERITGLRLPGQMADGTFSVSRSRTLRWTVEGLRAAIEDDARRAELIPELALTPRSRPGVKSPRFAATHGAEPVGVVQLAIDAVAGGRTRLTVTHERLATADEAEHWKAWWGDWLAALPEDEDEDES